jgi:molecular chaperone DnaK (HSP70)
MIVGIDLGTTYSLISHIDMEGKPALSPDGSYKDIFATPSAVYINDRNATVGALALNLFEQNPFLPLIRNFKKQFGEANPIYVDKASNKSWNVESIGALVLKKLALDAESYTGNKLEGAVVCVPANYNDVQRKAIKNAVGMAEIPLLGIIDEPVAAALHYGIQQKSKDQVIMAYDLGGGTFDATILTITEKGIYVLAKDGVIELGGNDFDSKISEMILEQCKINTGRELVLNAYTILQLKRTSEEIKIDLCISGNAYLKKTVLIGTAAFEVVIFKKDFEKNIEPLLDKTFEAITRCVQGSGLQQKDIEIIMLVGGSSLVPTIQKKLAETFCNPNQKVLIHEPMRAVAYGASLHASQISGDANELDIPLEFRGVSGYNIGIQTIDRQTGKTEVDCLIKKNMPLPAEATRTYYTKDENQDRIKLPVVQYHSKDELIHAGELEIGPLQNPKLNYAVEVKLRNEPDGTIKINVLDPNTGIELSQVFGADTNLIGNKLASQFNMVKNTFINNI